MNPSFLRREGGSELVEEPGELSLEADFG